MPAVSYIYELVAKHTFTTDGGWTINHSTVLTQMDKDNEQMVILWGLTLEIRG